MSSSILLVGGASGRFGPIQCLAQHFVSQRFCYVVDGANCLALSTTSTSITPVAMMITVPDHLSKRS